MPPPDEPELALEVEPLVPLLAAAVEEPAVVGWPPLELVPWPPDVPVDAPAVELLPWPPLEVPLAPALVAPALVPEAVVADEADLPVEAADEDEVDGEPDEPTLQAVSRASHDPAQ